MVICVFRGVCRFISFQLLLGFAHGYFPVLFPPGNLLSNDSWKDALKGVTSVVCITSVHVFLMFSVFPAASHCMFIFIVGPRVIQCDVCFCMWCSN